MNLSWKWKILQKKMIQTLFAGQTGLVSDELYTKMMYRVIFGRKLDLNAPKTYNDHLSRLKLRPENRALAKYADKFEARKYVASIIGDAWLNPVLGVYDDFDDIDFSVLPDKFALKCTHSSSYNLIVTDKSRLDMEKARKKFKNWMQLNYYFSMRESQYADIKPRIMCDRFLDNGGGYPLNEVKLYCIKGKVRFIMDNHEKDGLRFSNVYDRDWNKLDVSYGFKDNPAYGEPANAALFVELAERLAESFEFVRVDLYNIKGQPIFSELTFCPAGGMTPFKPDSFDYELGKYFRE